MTARCGAGVATVSEDLAEKQRLRAARVQVAEDVDKNETAIGFVLPDREEITVWQTFTVQADPKDTLLGR